jgi:DNA-binding NtrC family response regulator
MNYRPPVSQGKLLLVDDDPKLTEFLRETLAPHFSLVAVAGRIEQAKSLIDGPFTFNAIVCDHLLTDGTGLEFYSWLRKVKLNYTPFMLVTGQDELVKCQHDSSFGFMTKPFSPQDLLVSLEKFERQARQLAESSA